MNLAMYMHSPMLARGCLRTGCIEECDNGAHASRCKYLGQIFPGGSDLCFA